MSDLFRVYFDHDEIGPDGYPFLWHKPSAAPLGRVEDAIIVPSIKDMVRAHANHRCVRCHHPYQKGDGEWSACTDQCRHGGPMRVWTTSGGGQEGWSPIDPKPEACGAMVYAVGRAQAQWRILTVHHLNGVKHDCRWWNLVALCQRCHLTIQGKVHMQRPWRHEHSEWFKPYVAAFYAFEKLGEELTRAETMERLDELLALEDVQGTLL